MTNEAHALVFPEIEPEIALTRLEEPSFAVECRELRWWFIVPMPGARRRYAAYDHPRRNLTGLHELETTGAGKVYGEPCQEIRYRETRFPANPAEAATVREARAYGDLRGGSVRWFGWWNLSDERKLLSWKDPSFNEDWGGNLTRIADHGHFRWLSDRAVERIATEKAESSVEGIGAGLWMLKVGETTHRCLRTLDISARSVLMEGFINEAGRVVLARRYNGSAYLMSGGTAAEALRDCPTLACDGETYHLWYDCVTEEALVEPSVT